MSEAFTSGGSGSKVYTKSDCTYTASTRVLTFPSGVTWGMISKLLFAGYNNLSYTTCYFWKSNLSDLNCYGQVGSSSGSFAPTSSATSITINSGVEPGLLSSFDFIIVCLQ